MRFFSFAALAFAFAGCGTPQRLPVDIPRCDAVRTAHAVTLTAQVISRAQKPISGIALTVDFYRDFQTASLHAAATIKPELDPGKQRDVVIDVAATPRQAQGRAMRCFATHLSYLDGTSQDVAPAR